MDAIARAGVVLNNSYGQSLCTPARAALHTGVHWARSGMWWADVAADTPFALAWIGLCYSAQNLLYFPALSNISAQAYQVLSAPKKKQTLKQQYWIQLLEHILYLMLIMVLMRYY
mgnify:CR=1 FL=1